MAAAFPQGSPLAHCTSTCSIRAFATLGRIIIDKDSDVAFLVTITTNDARRTHMIGRVGVAPELGIPDLYHGDRFFIHTTFALIEDGATRRRSDEGYDFLGDMYQWTSTYNWVIDPTPQDITFYVSGRVVDVDHEYESVMIRAAPYLVGGPYQTPEAPYLNGASTRVIGLFGRTCPTDFESLYGALRDSDSVTLVGTFHSFTSQVWTNYLTGVKLNITDFNVMNAEASTGWQWVLSTSS